MKRIGLLGVCISVAMMGLVGCDWDTGSDATSWSSSYNWVNFSGVYRSAAGGLLVTDYTTTPSTPGSTNEVSGKASGTGISRVSASGTLAPGNIVPGSVRITLYAANGNLHSSYQDNGNGVLLGGLAPGTISYVVGSWGVDFSSSMGAPEGGRWEATYRYYVSNSGSSGSGAKPGSTGTIYSFTILQQGQHLTFTDNNGATYTGYIGEMRTASGTERSDEEGKFMPTDGDTMIATFECAGVSAALMQVKIVGTLQGTVASGVFTGRTLNGTWIEQGGKTGDINGQTTSVAISTTTTTTAADTNAAAMAVSP